MWAPQMGFPMSVCRKGAVRREGDYRQSLGEHQPLGDSQKKRIWQGIQDQMASVLHVAGTVGLVPGT